MNTSKDRFSLEDLSKIAGAESSEKILDFFHTLDTYITDEEVEAHMKKDTKQELVHHSTLRKDIRIEQGEKTKEAIIANFPEEQDRCNVVPQVI